MSRVRARNKGVTLMELIAAIAVVAILVVGALTLYGAANNGTNSTQMQRDLTGVQASVKSLYAGQAGYGTSGDSLVGTLKQFGGLPSDWSATTSGSTTTVSHQLNGNVTITSGGTNFSVELTAVPPEVCTKIASNAAAGWATVKIGSASNTVPVSTAAASAACGDTAQTMTFTSKN
jgi:prepilin-type N-terminal cleavage/methylation domain-containing protein